MKLTKYEKKTLKALVRELVIEKDGKYCLMCKPKLNPQIQMCHIYSMGRFKGMEFIPENIIPLCWYHHFHFAHKEPIKFVEWCVEHLSGFRMNQLHLYSQATKLSRRYMDNKLYLLQQIKELRDE